MRRRLLAAESTNAALPLLKGSVLDQVPQNQVSERVRLEGHIIDSLLLPKVMDIILREGGNFQIDNIDIGRKRQDPSWAEIEVFAPNEELLQQILEKLSPHGAVVAEVVDCKLQDADIAGCYPEGFYSSTNFDTEVRVEGEWLPVDLQEMDCAVVVDVAKRTAACVPMHRIKLGDKIIVGTGGVRVRPIGRARDEDDPETFKFMTSAVSSEKPKGVAVRDIAKLLIKTKHEGKKTLLVGGPAIVHTGAAEHVCRLLRAGYVQVLFAGNALAAHDIEQSMFHTSLGVDLDNGVPMEEGHQHHLRAINRIRRAGGIRQAVETGVLKSGIMFECIKHNVDYVLAGSIRDDGPLPDVITDVVAATDAMRVKRSDVGFCMMIATTLHSIATGNILPASVPTVCVDINPATVTKLADRGSAQSVGIVTDVEPFLRALVQEVFDLPERP